MMMSSDVELGNLRLWELRDSVVIQYETGKNYLEQLNRLSFVNMASHRQDNIGCEGHIIYKAFSTMTRSSAL
jgi:hypothetical protein